jgi:hypothetical protein
MDELFYQIYPLILLNVGQHLSNLLFGFWPSGVFICAFCGLVRCAASLGVSLMGDVGNWGSGGEGRRGWILGEFVSLLNYILLMML